MMADPIRSAPMPRPPADPALRDTLRQRAQDMEAAFLSEMLRHAGAGAARDGFGGGIGEDQFASFLREEQARAIAAAGGIGLAESIFRALGGAADGGR